MHGNCRVLWFLLTALVVAACSDDTKTATPDGAGPKEGGVASDTAVQPTHLSCAGDCSDFVVNKITLPNASTASMIGWDYNKDGTVDNALGSLLGTLSGMAGSFDIQGTVDKGVTSGDALVLLRLQAKDLVNTGSAAAQGWTAAQKQCCTNRDDVTGCAAEARNKCFGGSTTFAPAPDAPEGGVFGGSISAGAMRMGPSKLRFVLPVSAVKLSLTLEAVHLAGKVAADGKSISEGVLAGAISKSDLDNTVIPTVAQMLNATLNDPKTDATVKETLQNLFDTEDPKGEITTAEVASNQLIKTFLGGDVDVDGDGVKELSLGVGFEAVSCVINDSQ